MHLRLKYGTLKIKNLMSWKQITTQQSETVAINNFVLINCIEIVHKISNASSSFRVEHNDTI